MNAPIPSSAEPSPERVAGLLGGPKTLRHRVKTPLDAHDLIREGLPSRALKHLTDRLVVFTLTQAIMLCGMSLRTFQRLTPGRRLSTEQSSRTWRFADILTRATDTLGSQAAAEAWLQRPQIALDQRRPVDLLETTEGARLVEDVLGRLAYGVYT
jgi:putative toxin-antitoxin system antitoxin component (TIGR02293 family)